MKKAIFYSFYCLIAVALVLVSCKKDETVPKPTADFTFAADAADPATIKFTNASTNFKSVSWKFGDDAESTEESPSHTYAAGGTYKVELSVLGKDGSTVTASKDVTITGVEGPNLVLNGDFASGDNWTAIAVGAPGETTISFDNGALTFTGNGQINELVYQEIQLEQGDYNFSAHVKNDGSAAQTWVEFYLLDEAHKPTVGTDPTNPFVAWKTWDACKNTSIDANIETFSDCIEGSDKDGKITVSTTAKYYLGIKSGAWDGDLGTGIIVDNISLKKQ